MAEAAWSMKTDERSQQSSGSLTAAQKSSIVALVRRRPGLTGRQIAAELDLDKGRVNSFLYGEGKERLGLIVRHWHWSAPELTRATSTSAQRPQPTPILEGTTEPSLQDSLRTFQFSGTPRLATPASEPAAPGICRVLLQLPEARALRQIDRMEVEAIDRACAEDDYPDLGEDLQIALATRRASLLDRQEQARRRRTTTLWGWLVRIAAVALLIQLLWQVLRNVLSR